MEDRRLAVFLKTNPKTEVQALKEEIITLRKQLSAQKDLAEEYRRLHYSSSVRKQELFAAIRKLQAVIEEALDA
jgi:hypothetical protein